ncbi:MAG: diphosphomevalonate decarboxylase [Thermoanaerobaculales bacterium]|nr:diphosphomevalonate decarboxylase [Thermoanaerobaculales bacterium]
MNRTAVAHPNIALVKYWGKADLERNLPAVGSLSITLDGLTTRTRVKADPGAGADRLVLDGAPAPKARTERVRAALALIRSVRPDLPPLVVESENSFPTAAGLASSASGFAALVTAVNGLLDDGLDAGELAEIARRCSGSAPRSLSGGFVELVLDGSTTRIEPILEPEEWPLEVVIAVTSRAAKTVGSTEGMERTRTSSPYYDDWVSGSAADLATARSAVVGRDFGALAAVAEASCLKMHAVAMAAQPGLIYWNGTTVDCLHRVRELRLAGVPVFFTIDAGPQLKAVCAPGRSDEVAASMASVPGVVEVLRCGLGAGARLVED